MDDVDAPPYTLGLPAPSTLMHSMAPSVAAFLPPSPLLRRPQRSPLGRAVAAAAPTASIAPPPGTAAPTRRAFLACSLFPPLAGVIAAVVSPLPLRGGVSHPPVAEAASPPPSLRSRLNAPPAFPPPPRTLTGGTDLVYPPWLTGTWAASSVTVAVDAPSGVTAFAGGASGLSRVRAEVAAGTPTVYKVRFVPPPSEGAGGAGGGADPPTGGHGEAGVIADRAFNVRSLVGAVMGADAVREVVASPSVVTAVLRPAAAARPPAAAEAGVTAPPSPVEWRVRLDVVGRAAESDIPHAAFYGSEYTRQSVAAPGGGAPVVKWIETTTRYALVRSDVDADADADDSVRAGSHLRARAGGGGVSPVPVDVRVYEMVYERLSVDGGGGLVPGGGA
ncbi:hypothetical protein MMPV_008105 [Pyropia vietnamensis]